MLICRMIVETVSPLHIGGGEKDYILDDPVDRDIFGFWRIPGTSLAGLLRSECLKYFDLITTESLFGSSNGKDSSLVWCSDANLLDYDYESNLLTAYQKQNLGSEQARQIKIQMGPYIRDHVRISLTTGVAEDAAKFDEEIVPLGTRFAFELKFVDGKDKQESAAPDLVNAFLYLCSLLKQGKISFGGSLVNGFGRIKCVYCEVREFNLKEISGLESWLNLKKGIKFNQNAGVVIDLDKLTFNNPQKNITEGISFDFSLPLKTDGPLLPGGTEVINTPTVADQNNDYGADMVCLKTPKISYKNQSVSFVYTLSGSSLRGAIRHRCYDIAEIKYGKDEANKIIDSVFGFASNQSDGQEANKTLGASGKIYCSEIYFTNAKTKRVQHVAIDRFTGGAIKGALFDEAPLWGSSLKLKVRIRGVDLSPKETDVLNHALLDLMMGRLPLGGGTNRGNGIVYLEGDSQENSITENLQNISLTDTFIDKHSVNNMYEFMIKAEEVLNDERS